MLLRVALGSLVGLTSLSPSAAFADPGDACVSSYEGAQAARKSGELVRSKAELRLCLGACPAALAGDCKNWLDEIGGQLTELSVRVIGPESRPLVGARVFVDGVERRAGAPIELDPGRHELRAESDGYAPRTEAIALAPGARASRVITLDRAGTAPAREPNLAGPIALGTGGLVALTVAAALAIAGHVDVSAMRSSCAPRCAPDRVDMVENLWTAGGIVAGAGGAALVGATIWLGLTLSPPAAAPAPGRTGLWGIGLGGTF